MKFKCIISRNDNIKVGRIIDGEKSKDDYIVLNEDLIIDGRCDLKIGDKIPINGALWVWEPMANETPISCLMRQLDVIDEEEFNIILGDKKESRYNPFRFKNGKLLDKYEIDAYNYLPALIYGNCTIEKLPPKSEEELKLEEIQKTIDELQKQKDELETVIKGK